MIQDVAVERENNQEKNTSQRTEYSVLEEILNFYFIEVNQRCRSPRQTWGTDQGLDIGVDIIVVIIRA